MPYNVVILFPTLIPGLINRRLVIVIATHDFIREVILELSRIGSFVVVAWFGRVFVLNGFGAPAVGCGMGVSPNSFVRGSQEKGLTELLYIH